MTDTDNGGRMGVVSDFFAGVGKRFRALPKWQRMIAFLAFVVFLYYLPLLGIPGLTWLRTDSIEGGNNWAGVLFTCAIYVLIALGLNVVIGLAGLLDLGYVGFFAVGAYSVALFGSRQSPVVKAIQEKWDLSQDWAVAWAVCIPIALALAMISGVILGWPTLRLRGDYLAIVTLGFGEIIRIVVRNSTGWSGGPAGVAAIPGPQGAPSADNNIFGLIDAKPWYWLALSVVLVVVFLVRRLENSRVGRSWLAIREDQEAAEIMGVRTIKYKLWAFAIGAFIGGLGGVMFAGQQGFMNSQTFVLQFSILVLAGVVMGGSGNIAGAILGGALISYIPDRLRGIEDPIWHTDLFGFRFAIFGAVIIAIMIFRPQGLIPSRRRAMELKDREKEVAPQ